MVPVVRINDARFADLKAISTWLGTETPAQTIDAIVIQMMERLGLERDGEPEMPSEASIGDVLRFDSAPGLAFTKPLSASVNGKAIGNPRWSAILLAMIAHVKTRGIEGEKLARELQIPAKARHYEDEGFKHHPNLGISIQGQSASDAWKEIDRIAKKWQIPVTVEFQWRDNPKAQFPGRVGLLQTGSA
jgi:hypothetical protein